MHAGTPPLLLGSRHKAGIHHAERAEDVLAEIGVERHAGYRFDQAPDPIDIDAVFPSVAGIEGERPPQRRDAAR